jgi:eukaryotic-like serine/threonine-protein kinase
VTDSGSKGDPTGSDSGSMVADPFVRAVAHSPSLPPPSESTAASHPTNAEADLTGRTLLHFHVVERLGAGGMGVVYRAIDEKLRRPVALKVLSSRLLADARHRETLLREARSAAAVNHPNIASIYEVHDGGVEGAFFVMELVEGETLRACLSRQGAMPVAEALRIASSIARGLSRAHAAAIVHRDLKCENVMLGPDGHVKLLDFGLASVHGVENAAPAQAAAAGETAALAPTMPVTATPTTGGQVAGTPASMAPEQARGEAVDPRADVYAFGVVLYEMLTGALPFAHRKGRPWEWGNTTSDAWRPAKPLRVIAPKVPRDVDALVARCLAYEKSERPADGSALVAEVEGCARGLSNEGRSTKSRTWGALVGLLVSIGLAGAGLASRGIHRATTGSPASSASAAPSPSDFSRSSNPEAQRLFDDAMRSFHDGTAQELPLLKRAVEADPSFAEAYLRLWILSLRIPGEVVSPGEEPNEYRRHVVQLESALTPRERAIVDFVEDPDVAGTLRKVDAYLARYRGDCMDWWYRVSRAADAERSGTEDRALEIDPSCIPVLELKGTRLHRLGMADALPVLNRCLELSPHAVRCLSTRATLADYQGECAQAEADIRQWLDLEPDAPEAHEALAGILVRRGESIAAVRETLAGLRGSLGSDSSPEVAMATFEGDFSEVLRLASDLASRVPTTAEDYQHFNPLNAMMLAYTETGDRAAAARVASDYLSRRSVWRVPCPMCEAAMTAAAARGGRLDRKIALARITAAFDTEVASGMSPETAWAQTFAFSAQTTPEATDAVAKLDELGVLPQPRWWMGSSSRTMFLAGRKEEARPILESLARICSGALSAMPWVHSHLYLGELDEEAGDKPSACAHYAKVLERWGHAKPRSVTADEARTRSKRLGCGS